MPMIARAKALSQFLTRNPYRKEITTIILLKLAGLTLLWWFFFSKPVEEHLNHPELVTHYTSAEMYHRDAKRT